VIPSHVLTLVAGILLLVLAHGAWIWGVTRAFWKWREYGTFWLCVGVLVTVDIFIAALIFEAVGK